MIKKKPTRKEKSIINKANHSENKKQLLSDLKSIQKDFIPQAEDRKDKFLECIEVGFNMLESRAKSKFDLRDHYNLIKEDEQYSEDYARAREIANENILENLMTISSEEPRTIFDSQSNKIYDVTQLKWRQSMESTAKYVLGIKNPGRFATNRNSTEISNKDDKPFENRTMVVTQAELDAATQELENESQ